MDRDYKKCINILFTPYISQYLIEIKRKRDILEIIKNYLCNYLGEDEVLKLVLKIVIKFLEVSLMSYLIKLITKIINMKSIQLE